MKEFLVGLTAAAILLFGFFLGSEITEGFYKKELLKKGFARYNSRTAAFELTKSCGGKE